MRKMSAAWGGEAPDVVEESAEGLERVGPHVLELLDELLGALLGNGGGVNGGGLILEEITVVLGRQVQLHVCVFRKNEHGPEDGP